MGASWLNKGDSISNSEAGDDVEEFMHAIALDLLGGVGSGGDGVSGSLAG
jgi:hypothetical protein